MGIIAAVTPGIKHQTPIQRESATAHDIALKAKIDIHFFRPTQEVTSLFYDTQILVKGQGSNWEPRCYLENIMATTITSTWLVGHDAKRLSRNVPRSINNHFPANDRYESQWTKLCVLNPQVCACTSLAAPSDSSDHLWSAIVVESTDDCWQQTTWEWFEVNGFASGRLSHPNELLGHHRSLDVLMSSWGLCIPQTLLCTCWLERLWQERSGVIC